MLGLAVTAGEEGSAAQASTRGGCPASWYSHDRRKKPHIVRDTLRRLKTRLADILRTFGPVEAAMALFFASALWLPPFVGNKAYLPTLAVLVLYAAYKTIRERRMPPIPLFLVAYLGVYVLATIHGGNLDLASVKQGYFARPLTALVVATIVTTARQRLNVLILVVLFALSQVPIAAVQVSETLIRYGRPP